jgi:AGZA family xanthine/uracil permease-like MFS transporter
VPSGRRSPRWLAPGDWNAFFALALDNTTQLVILSSLLIGVFKFPADLVLGRMVPGTAAGVLVGDLVYTWLAIRLMRRTGRDDVTAMPFGIDTPSLFGIVFGVLYLAWVQLWVVAQALLGPSFRVSVDRGGHLVDSALAPFVLATVHPSSLLRTVDADREQAIERFIADLKTTAAAVKKAAG